MNITDLRALLEEIGLERIKQSGNNLMACCPAHPDRRPSWGISLDHPHLHVCFSCGFKGTLRTLLLYKGWSLARANDRIGVAIRSTELTFGDTASREVLPTAKEEDFWVYALEAPAVRYMRSRGIPYDVLVKTGVAYHPRDERVLFPWYWQGRFLGATGRTIDPDNEVKIVGYFDVPKLSYFYAPNRGEFGRGPIPIVEGEIDALKVFTAGFHNVLAVGRGTYSAEQLERLTNLPVNSVVVLMLDYDKAGRRLSEQIGSELQKRGYCVHAVKWTSLKNTKSKVDPGMLSGAVIRRLITEAPKANTWSLA